MCVGTFWLYFRKSWRKTIIESLRFLKCVLSFISFVKMSLGLNMPETCSNSTSFDWWNSWVLFFWKFRCLIPFEFTEATHWTVDLFLLYILVLDYSSVIPILLARCFSDRLLCGNLGRCWAPWECRGLQVWAPRVHHSHLWGYFWIQIPSVEYSEVQGGYGVYQETLCVWHGCHITRWSHNLRVPCIRGYARIPWSCGFKAVGTGYHQRKVSRITFTSKVIQFCHWTVDKQGFRSGWFHEPSQRK